MTNKIDIKYIDVPNICFSLTDENDDREEKFKQQRIERGFDDSETWSLRDTIANFISPRLTVFRDKTVATPSNLEEKEWHEILTKMIRAFDLVRREEGTFILTDDEQKEYEEGIELYNEYFMALWW